MLLEKLIENIKENSMAYKRKAFAGTLVPNIQRGGTAIPLGNNLYWMKGRKHNSGGIDIGKDLEVENNEVMQMLPNETRVFSSVKMLGGNSPAELVASGLNPSVVFSLQELYKKLNRINDDGTRYKNGGKAKLGKRIKGAEENGSRDIYYDDEQRRWVWGSNRQVLPLGHRVKLDDGYEYQLNSDGSRTRIGKKPNAYERMITSPMQYTPNNDKLEAIGDVLTAPFADQSETYYNGILPLRNGSQYKDAPLYAYRTGDMSYLKNDDNYIRTIDRSNNPALPRKLYTFYNQDTIYLPKPLMYNLDKLKRGIGMNQENVNRDYIYGAEYKPIIDARNHHMQLRQLDNGKYVADFSDVFDVNDEFFDSKANPMIFSQYGVPIEFTGDNTKWNYTFVNEINNALNKKYGGKMNLQNSVNNSLINNKRMISQNKLGTVVRIDGAGRDRLAYIPSTGSSKQDMKCGGRVKAETGTNKEEFNFIDVPFNFGYYPPLTDDIRFEEDIEYNVSPYNTSYRTPAYFSKDARPIGGLRLPYFGFVRPSDTFMMNYLNKGFVNTNGLLSRSRYAINNNSSNNNNKDWSSFLNGFDFSINNNNNKPNGDTAIIKVENDNSNNNDDGFETYTGIDSLYDKTSSYEKLVDNMMKGQSDVPGYIAAGTNILGSVINGLIANNALNKQHAPVRPIPKIAQKLKTKYNINAQLSEIRNELAGQINNVTRNTASSHTLRNLYNNLGLASLTALNKLHEDKENKETELINKDIINRQTTDHENVEAYNKWLENLTNFYNNRSMLRAQNWANMVNGIGSGIGQALGNIGATKRLRNNTLIAMLPYIKAIGG